jgi:hypothetical protein
MCSYYHIWVDEYIIKKHNTINLEHLSCPKCGNYISNENLKNYNDFYDYFLTDDQKRLRINQVNQWFNQNYIYNIERKSLLCYNCELEEDYTEDIFFRYKGYREYNLISYFGLYNWTVLYIINNSKDGYWNEYRKVINNQYDIWDNDIDEESE